MEGRCPRSSSASDPVATLSHGGSHDGSWPYIPSFILGDSTRRDAVPSRKLSVGEAACHLGLSKSFLDKSRINGGGPAFLKLGRRVLYDEMDLEAWAANNKRWRTA